MFRLKLVHALFALNVALLFALAAAELPLEFAEAEIEENAELIRNKREPLPRRGHLLHLLGHKHQVAEYRPSGHQEYHHHHTGGGGNTATFAQSSAGTINTNGGHGNGASQSSSQSASYSFGPFSASFSASQSNANAGGFFDY